MKKLLLSAIFIITALLSLTITMSAASVIDANGNEYFSSEENIFYLPSHISPSSVQIKDGTINTYSLSKSADAKGNEAYFMTIGYDSYTFYFANNLPSVYVSSSLTRDELLGDGTKDEYAKTTITDKYGSIHYLDTNSTYSEIRTRGNATKSMLKLPFQLKLSAKQELLGMKEAKTWLLLANYMDQSLIRNSVMYKIGELLGMDTCDFRSVDLYVNGEYLGVYLLCEKVQIQENRIDIYDLEEEMEELNPTYPNSTVKITYGDLINETIITEYQYVAGIRNVPEDISGGYLVELDNNYYSSEKCYFKTSNGNAYVIKSPEKASKAQVEHIARIFGEMEEAIYSPTGKNSRGLHYSQYIDVESLAYAYIAAEFGRNWDAGSSSMYFYKDRDVNGQFTKMVKGPLWDCDNTLGNMLKGDANNQTTYWAKSRNLWKGLTKHDYFNYKVAEAFERVCPLIINLTSDNGYISDLVKEIGSSIVMEQSKWKSNDYENWPMYSEYVFPGIHYDDWQNSQTFQFIPEYSNGVDNDETTVIGYLKKCIVDRANFLSSEWSPLLQNEEPSISADGLVDVTLTPPTYVAVQPEPPVDTDTDTSIDSDTNIGTDTDTSIDSDTNIGTDTDTSLDTSTNTDTNTDNNFDSNTNIGTDTDTSLDTSTNTDTNTDNNFDSNFDDNDDNDDDDDDDEKGTSSALIIVSVVLGIIALSAVIALVVVLAVKNKK